MFKVVHRFLLLSLAFTLIAEWVYPFHNLLKITGSWGTLLFIASCLLIYGLQLRFLIAFPLQLLLYYLCSSFAVQGNNPLTSSSLTAFFAAIKSGIAATSQLHATTVPIPFIYLIFLIALTLLTYITYHSIFRKKRILAVLIMTILYLLIINTFTQYDATAAIVRSCLVGFVILYAANYHGAGNSFRRQAFYIGSTGLLLTVMLLAAMNLPVYKPHFPDPIPTLKSRFGLQDSTRQIGYSEDDSRLGGTLAGDHTEVFRAKAEQAHYYRVEAKWQYTGKGWETPAVEKTQSFQTLTDFPVELAEKYNPQEEKVDITFAAANRYLLYPYGTQALESNVGSFRYQPAGDKITASQGIKTYELKMREPVYAISKLKHATTNKLSRTFLARYTQVPQALPKRIKRLTERITAGKKTLYEKTKAIETYLNSEGGYRYSTEQAEVTARDKDYVDQFLFDTKVGYCDNFSTAMVVMLRSIGIPARWAKGFTGGTMIRTSENGQATYRITNDDAHSWPEVYFSGTGWVPFEPTATFTNPERFSEEASTVPGQSDDETADETAEDDSSAADDGQSESAQKAPKQAQEQQASNQEKTTAKQAKALRPAVIVWSIAIPLGILLIATAAALRYRRQLRLWALQRRVAKRSILFTVGYERLLAAALPADYQRRPGETWRQSIQTLPANEALLELTTRYETIVYGTATDHYLSQEDKRLFETVFHSLLAAKKHATAH